MYNKHAFVHWYLNAEMELEEFVQAREELAWLEKDYEEIAKDTELDPVGSDEEGMVETSH